MSVVLVRYGHMALMVTNPVGAAVDGTHPLT